MRGLWIAAVTSGCCALARAQSGPPYDAGYGLSDETQTLASGNQDALYALSDSLFVSISRSQQSVLYTEDGGENWKAPNDSGVDQPLIGEPQHLHGFDCVWILREKAFTRFKINQFNIPQPYLPYSMASQFGKIHSLEPHPRTPDEAVICGDNECSVISLGYYSTESVEIAKAVKCVMDPYAHAAAWCIMDHSYSVPRGMVYLNVNHQMELDQVVSIDKQRLESVSDIFTTRDWTVAVVKDRLAVKGPKAWAYTSHKKFDAITFQRGAADGIIAHVERNGLKYTWVLSSDGLSFIETRDEDAPVTVVRETLYSLPNVSYNNGHTWSRAPKIVEDIDFSTLLTSQRLNVATTKAADRVLYTYDGIEWRSASPPFSNQGGKMSLMLVDHGSAIVAWRRGTNEAYFTQASDLADWSDLDLYLNDPSSEYSWTASPESPQIIFHGTGGTFVVDLRPLMGGGRACSSADLDRIDQSMCALGSRTFLMVRAKAAQCVMGPLAENQFISQSCECTLDDYTCGAHYVLAGSQCVPDAALSLDMEEYTSGSRERAQNSYVSILGSRCKGGFQPTTAKPNDKDGHIGSQTDSVESSVAENDQTKVNKVVKEFSGNLRDYLYLPGSEDTQDEETVLLWTSDGELYVSADQGTSWAQPENVRNVLSVFTSDTTDNQVYLATDNSMENYELWVSWDRAKTFEKISLPARPSLVFSFVSGLLKFHPEHPNWMIYNGMKDCDQFFCPGEAHLSKDGGKSWTKFSDDVSQCYWVSDLILPTSKDLVYCVDYKMDGDTTFSWSDDYYASGPKSVIGLSDSPFEVAVTGKYVIAGYQNEAEEPELAVSRDGVNFEPVNYPENFKFSKLSPAAVVNSNGKSIKLFQTVSSKTSHEFGVLLKSDEGGTNFIRSLENVNRASFGFFSGFVDYDTMQSVRGVALANVVANAKDVLSRGVSKKIQTMITHSEGAHWAPLIGPMGQNLHLHGYTDRLDTRNQPSSPTAIGMMLGRGNEGDQLGDLRSSQTYMTRDAGITWKKVSDRPMFWEFGDSGSVVVLIDSMEPTNKITYSLDEGDTWQEYVFSDYAIKVINLATIPSDTSRKFIIFGIPPVGYGDIFVSVQIDFSGLTNKVCGDSDLEWWAPSQPQIGTKCLLGEEVEYLRKKADRQCIVGKHFADLRKQPEAVSRVVKTCTCTREDYECDINYEKGADGTCTLVPGTNAMTMEAQCAKGAISWHKVTGYRKIAMSACEGGEQLDEPEQYACPGKEEQFKKEHDGGNSKPGNGGDSQRGDSSPGFFTRIWRFVYYIIIGVFFILFFAALIYVGYTIFKKVRPGLDLGDMSQSVRFPDSELPQHALHRSLDVVQSVSAHAVGLWRLIRSNIPFLGSQVPQDRLGFYSRMSDDERYRLLEEDGFEDESDGAAEDVFIDEEQDLAGAVPFNDEDNAVASPDIPPFDGEPFADDGSDAASLPSHEHRNGPTASSEPNTGEYRDEE